MKLKKKYNICKSQYPTGEKTHIILLQTFTKQGCSCGKVYQGTLQECKEKIKELRKKKNAS